MTTTIPVEAVYAAGCVPVDLNNVFITAANPAALVAEAEYQGYPHNACGWIKGIYTTALQADLDALIAVVEGDCSQTQAMVETLQMQGIKCIPFAFPYGRDRDLLKMQIDKLLASIGADWQGAMQHKFRLDRIRKKVARLDELTWTKGVLSSRENHYYQVCCSDFNGDPDRFEAEVDQRLDEAESQPTEQEALKLGYVGVPTIFSDLYEFLESLGTKIVFNEVQRQFAMPCETKDLIDQYSRYTYPYDIFARIEDIKTEIERRGIRGLVHYTQSFCFRQIQDLIVRRSVDIPILTLEGDSPARLDVRTRVRIESFIEMLA